MNNYGNPAPFESDNIDEANMGDLFGEDFELPNFDLPGGPLSPIHQQDPYQQQDGQQHGLAPPDGEQFFVGGMQPFTQDAYDQHFFAQQTSLPAAEQQPYQQVYGQQYETPFPGAEQQFSPQGYGPPFVAQTYAPPQFDQPLPPQQEQPYQAVEYPTYETPAPVRETRPAKKAPKKTSKHRVSKKVPRKAPRKSSPVAQLDETDYTSITTLIPSESATCTRPNGKYWTFMDDHLTFVIMRFASVCVALCREPQKDTEDAAKLGQIAVDFFSKEMWAIAVKHYIEISKDGDDFDMMRACMADCIATFKLFYSKELARELQDLVVVCGLWYAPPKPVEEE